MIFLKTTLHETLDFVKDYNPQYQHTGLTARRQTAQSNWRRISGTSRGPAAVFCPDWLELRRPSKCPSDPAGSRPLPLHVCFAGGVSPGVSLQGCPGGLGVGLSLLAAPAGSRTRVSRSRQRRRERGFLTEVTVVLDARSFRREGTRGIRCSAQERLHDSPAPLSWRTGRRASGPLSLSSRSEARKSRTERTPHAGNALRPLKDVGVKSRF